MSDRHTQSATPEAGDMRRVSFLGALCAVLWIAVFLWISPPEGWGVLSVVLAFGLPLLMILGATQLARSLVVLRAEASGLRRDLESARQPAQSEIDAAFAADPEPVATAPPPTEAASPPPKASAHNPQASLALEPEQAKPQPLTSDELISALQFPETPDDRAGFRALRRAMQDHRASLVVQAAQDVLTLLSQDGIYTDDLQPDRARPEIWRRFAQGERGGPVADVGGIRDAGILEVCTVRLRENAVFRDAVHHFVRRFDRLLSTVEPELSDQDLALLADTRSARAFMLLARAMGVFG